MVELRILGQPQLFAPDGQPLETLSRQPKRAALLAYLALPSPGLFHRRDKLFALFWPELDEQHARNALSQALHVLRTALGNTAILTRGDAEVGISAAMVRCDAVAFEQALEAGRTADALEHYRGDLLDGLFIADAGEFERWLEQERERFRRRAALAASQAAAACATAGEWRAALRFARRAHEIEPYDEALFRQCIGVLDRIGDRAGAMRAYREFARRLKADLEVEPSPETVTAVEGVRSREANHAVAFAATAIAPPPRRRRLPLLAAVLLLVAVVAGRMAFTRQRLDADPTLGTPSPHHVAVFPFKVDASPELEYLSEGVMDVLSEAIDELGDFRRTQPLALMSRLRRAQVEAAIGPDHAAPIAEQLGARRYILGHVVELGRELRISASLFDLGDSSRPLAEASVQGPAERLPELVTQLTRSIVRDVPLGGGARLGHVGTLRAANFPAFKFYLQGEALVRRGWYDSAAVKLRQAVAADSTFAVAWYRLGLVLGLTQSFGEEGDNYASLARAARFEGLSRRDRALANAWRAHFRGQPEVAERLAREVVGSYPDDVEAWHLLGLTRMWYAWERGRPFADARTALERALLIDPRYPDALYHATALAIIEQRYKDADSLAALAPKGVGAWAVAKRALLVFMRGDQPEQQRLMRNLDRLDDQTLLAVGGILVNHSDSMLAARRVYTRLIIAAERSDWARAQAALYLAHLEAGRGRWHEADRAFGRAARWDPALAFTSYAWLFAMPFFERAQSELAAVRDSVQAWAPPRVATQTRLQPQVIPDLLALPDELRPWIKDYLLGLLDARLGDATGAEEFARRLERAQEPRDTVGLRHDLAIEIRALVALEADRPEDALKLLEQARMSVATADQAWYPRYYSRPFGRFLRAETLHRLGRDDEALGWYNTFCEKYGTEYTYRPIVFLRQAQIAERRGQSQRAHEYYRRFLARWRDADPEYQGLVRDVEQRIN